LGQFPHTTVQPEGRHVNYNNCNTYLKCQTNALKPSVVEPVRTANLQSRYAQLSYVCWLLFAGQVDVNPETGLRTLSATPYRGFVPNKHHAHLAHAGTPPTQLPSAVQLHGSSADNTGTCPKESAAAAAAKGGAAAAAAGGAAAVAAGGAAGAAVAAGSGLQPAAAGAHGDAAAAAGTGKVVPESEDDALTEMMFRNLGSMM
jgi:hypothetical protein